MGLQRCRLARWVFDGPIDHLIKPRLQAAGRGSGEGILPALAPVLADRFQQEDSSTHDRVRIQPGGFLMMSPA